MMKQKQKIRSPLTTIATPRCGSSLITGILAEHGYWVGEPIKPTRVSPTGNYENKGIQKGIFWKMKKEGRKKLRLHRPGLKQEIIDVITKQGYVDNQRWIYKVEIQEFYAWYTCFPEATYVFCRRDKGSITASKKHLGIQNLQIPLADALELYDDVQKFCRDLGKRQKKKKTKRTFFVIDYERVMIGDYHQFLPIVEAEGFEFKPEIADRLVDPQHKHF